MSRRSRSSTTPSLRTNGWRMRAQPLFLSVLCLAWSLLPLSAPAAADVSGSLVIAGNGPELNTMEALARAFEKANPRAYVDLLWEDTAKPLDLVKSGQAQIAVTGADVPGLRAKQIGWDGIGILVHLSNFTKELTKQQVADIFSGKITTWSDVGGPDTRILLIDRPSTQNIREAFQAQVGLPGGVASSAKVIGRDEQVVKTVVGTLPPLSAVAYISLSTGLSVVSTGVAVRLVQIDKIEPEAPTVKDGRYPLRRPLLLVSKPETNPLIEAFAQFALSPAGQAIVAETYVPMPGP